MSAKETDKLISVSTEISVKASPSLEQIAYKAVAGLSEQDLIERNTIATLETGESEPAKL